MMLSVGIVLCDCLLHVHLHSHKQTEWSREETILCEFWSFCGSIAEDSIFLGYDATSLGNLFRHFEPTMLLYNVRNQLPSDAA